jgi:alkylated DNA nucleotide flippase Atl1
VGSLLRRAPSDTFAWWRVIAASGRLLASHEAEQASRLRREGVEVCDGRIVP